MYIFPIKITLDNLLESIHTKAIKFIKNILDNVKSLNEFTSIKKLNIRI
jgi:hypothetical protein